MNYNPLDDEEERKRREAIAARMDEEAYANPVGPVNPSFLDQVGTAIGNRFDSAMDRVSNAGNALMNPQQALQQRMMGDQRQEQQDEAANTEVQTQTTKSYADGSQEKTVKTQVPAEQAQGGARLTTPIAGMPQNLPAQGSISPEQANAPVAMAKLPEAGPQVQVAGPTQMPPQAKPQFQRPTGAMPPVNYGLAPEQGQAPVRMPQMAPQAGQVAAAPGASLAQAGANAQAQPTPYTPTAEREVPQPSSWVQAANDAGSDLSKLFDVAAKHPESRDIIIEKTKRALQQKTKEDEAQKLFSDAAAGDIKAQNKIFQSIRPETGKQKEEVTTSDYVKAILYKRLGLDALAQQAQLKILGKETTFEQTTINGSNWQVEKDSSGNIIRAKDDEGTIATEATLNKLRANAQKFGTQATSFAGGLHTVPNAAGDGQDLVMPAANTIDPSKSGFVYMSGPKKGQPYNGTTTPVPQSIGTDFSKNVNRAFVEFQTKPSIAAATKALETAALLSPKDYNDTLAAIRGRSPEIFNQIMSGQAGTPPTPTNAGAQGGTTGATGSVAPPKPATLPPVSGSANPNATAGVGGSGLLGKTEGIKADIATNAAIKQAELKQPAEERGKQQVKQIQQQGFADSTYPLVSHISDLIKKSTGSGLGAGIDSLTRVIGVGTKGSQAIKQLETFAAPLVSMVPRFEGSQSDNDVLLYRQQAGDFANPKLTDSERLAALQGMIDLLKIYDKAGNNDWSFGGKPVAQQGGKDGKGGKQKVVKLD